MKFSPETLEIINGIKDINAGSPVQGAVFKSGSLIKARRYKSAAPIMYANINEEIPRDFAVYDLKKFLSLFKLLDDPELSFEDDYIVFKSGRKRAKIKYVAPHLIENDEFFQKEIKMPPTDFACEITAETLKTIKTATAMMASPEIAFISDGKKVVLTSYNTRDPKSDKFEIDVGESDKEFTVIIAVEFLQFLNRDYNVSISLKGLLKWEAENLTYFITMSEKSKV